MTQPGNGVRRCFEMNIRDQQDRGLMAHLDSLNIRALFVEQEGGNVDGNLNMDGASIFLHRFLFQNAQNVERSRFSGANMTGAGTAWAGDIAGFGKGRAQALAGEFHQAKAANLAHLDAGAVETQRIAQAIFHFTLIALVFHVDEVDDNQATEVTQAELASQFFSGFKVRFECRFFNIRTFGRATGVDVDCNQRFGVVNDNGAARRQIDLTTKGCFDLVLDLETGKKRHIVVVALDAMDVARHDSVHESTCLLVNFVGVDQDFADFRLEVIANGANYQAAFQINQESATLLFGGAFNGGPQL